MDEEREYHLHFDFRFKRRHLAAVLAVLLMGIASITLDSETLTLTTSYPAPSGVYNQMIVTGQTTLARDTATNGSRVGVGTASPQQLLDVNGVIQTEGARLHVNGFDSSNFFWMKTPNAEPNSVFLGVTKDSSGNPSSVLLWPQGDGNGLTVWPGGSAALGGGGAVGNFHVHSPTAQGMIAISGPSDSGDTYSALYLFDDFSHLNDSWVLGHWKLTGTPAEDSFILGKWMGSTLTGAMNVLPNGDTYLGAELFTRGMRTHMNYSATVNDVNNAGGGPCFAGCSVSDVRWWLVCGGRYCRAKGHAGGIVAEVADCSTLSGAVTVSCY